MENIFYIMEHFLESIKNTVIYFSSLIYNALMYWHSLVDYGVYQYIMPVVHNSNFPILIIFVAALMLQIIFLPTYVYNLKKKDTFLVFIHAIIILTCNFYIGWIFQEKFKQKELLPPADSTLYMWYFISTLAAAVIFFYFRPKYDSYFKEILQKNPFHAYFQLTVGFLVCTYSFCFQMPLLGALFIVAMGIMDCATRILYYSISKKKVT